MTTKEGAMNLHPLEMKKAFVSTCREMFHREKEFLGRLGQCEFSPRLVACTFDNRNVLVEGMGRFLFKAMDAESKGEAAAGKAIRAHMRMGAVDVAASLVAILLNTRSEVPFFAAIAASEKMMGVSPFFAEKTGRMRASVEFFKACAEEGVEYPEVVIGSELATQGLVAGTAAVLGRGTESGGYEGLSLFRGVLAISGLVFEDENTLTLRSRLLDEYTLACRLLFSECQCALPMFSTYFAMAVKGQMNGDGGMALIRLFTTRSALREMADAKGDPRGLQLAIDGIVGLEERAEEKPGILLRWHAPRPKGRGFLLH